MYDIGVAIWLLLVGLVGLNGFAAGMAATLHLWRGMVRPRIRIILAATVSGLLPFAMLAAPLSLELGSVSDAPQFIGAVIIDLDLDVVFAFNNAAQFIGAVMAMILIVGLGTLVSLPGATVITRKLAGRGDAYKSFE